jgi:hypothetical protein
VPSLAHVFLIAWVAATAAPTRTPSPRRTRHPATRVPDAAIRIDGRVDEPTWRRVPLMPRLVQTSPRYGAAPTHETEVRVAYGDRGLYVAFVCHDDGADVRGAYARRDEIPPSDTVGLDIDPNHDHTHGYTFVVNASGAQADAQMSRDDAQEWSWDGVWKAAARRHGRGWSAEMFIPWSTLRFDARDRYTFGINVARNINKEEEVLMLAPPPQGLPGRLSYAHDYVGVTGIAPGLNLELRPYVSMRFTPRLPSQSLDRSWRALPNAGIESKYGLRGNLTLDVAVNPDFGQAEVDPAVLNLSPFEVFFPEKRQFFLESKDIFETRFQLFHSRRVGRSPSPGRAETSTRTVAGDEEAGEVVGLDPHTRILEAVRVTGDAAPGWRIGAMTATTGPTFGVQRFSDGSEDPVTVDPTMQHTVARVRRQYDSQTHLGGIVTAVHRASGDQDAYAGGVDYGVRFRRHWRKHAQVIGTHDGDRAGMGASGVLERNAKNWETELGYELLTPHANFNDLGYMRNADFVRGNVGVGAFNAQPIGDVRHVGANARFNVTSTFDGLVTDKDLHVHTELTTDRLWSVELFGGGSPKRMDPYETRGGIPYEIPAHWWGGMWLASPYNRRFHVRLSSTFGVRDGGPGPDLSVDMTVRPLDRVQIQLGSEINTWFNRPRWVDTDEDDVPVFGRSDVITAQATLRTTLGILPTLTLQSYSHLLCSTAHHDEFYLLTSPSTLEPTGSEPYEGLVDQSLTALTSNWILRWEYVPGSFLYLVYTHRTALDAGGTVAHFRPENAILHLVEQGASHEDIVFIKLAHLFGL